MTVSLALELRNELEEERGADWVTAQIGFREVRYAEHLLVKGHVEQAQRFLAPQVQILRRERLNADLALALRIQGDCINQIGMASEWIFEEALSLARNCEEPFVLVECELAFCRSLIREGDIQSAARTLELASARSRNLNFRAQALNCELIRALLLNKRGKTEESRAVVAQCQELARGLGYAWLAFHTRAWGIDADYLSTGF